MVRAAREPAPDEELMFEVQRDRQHADDDTDFVDEYDGDSRDRFVVGARIGPDRTRRAPTSVVGVVSGDGSGARPKICDRVLEPERIPKSALPATRTLAPAAAAAATVSGPIPPSTSTST